MIIESLGLQDLEGYRTLRLEALRESPTAFGSSYEEELTFPEEAFASRLQPEKHSENRVFGARMDGRLAGIAGFLRETRRKQDHIATLVSMYVLPEFRAHGIDGALLLDEAITYGKSLSGLRHIKLAVTSHNTSVRALYVSRGFHRFALEPDAICVDDAYLDYEHMVLNFRKDDVSN